MCVTSLYVEFIELEHIVLGQRLQHLLVPAPHTAPYIKWRFTLFNTEGCETCFGWDTGHQTTDTRVLAGTPGTQETCFGWDTGHPRCWNPIRARQVPYHEPVSVKWKRDRWFMIGHVSWAYGWNRDRWPMTGHLSRAYG